MFVYWLLVHELYSYGSFFILLSLIWTRTFCKLEIIAKMAKLWVKLLPKNGKNLSQIIAEIGNIWTRVVLIWMLKVAKNGKKRWTKVANFGNWTYLTQLNANMHLLAPMNTSTPWLQAPILAVNFENRQWCLVYTTIPSPWEGSTPHCPYHAWTGRTEVLHSHLQKPHDYFAKTDKFTLHAKLSLLSNPIKIVAYYYTWC